MKELLEWVYSHIHYTVFAAILVHCGTFIVGYFMFLRGAIRRWVTFPKQPIMSKRERKIQKKREHSRKKVKRTPKEKAMAFWDWLWCKCYDDEQKREYYNVFLIINHLYIITFLAIAVLLLLAMCIPSIQPYALAIHRIKTAFEYGSWLIAMFLGVWRYWALPHER
ncbi:MAG: hypothetical protein IJE00_06930 [Clostridia bacterium]|nr:hypothetical protein [Clostridia bacterium]